MFEDDYLLRLIKEMVRTVLKLLFHIDFKEEDPVSVVFESEDAEKTLYSLIHLADQGFINDAEVWLLMLKRRNTSVHIWNEDEVNEMIILIRDSFIPAFKILNETLLEKLDEAESDWR